MSQGITPRGASHVANKKLKGNKSRDKKDEQSDSSVVSFDSIISYSKEFDEIANYTMLQKHFDEKVLLLKTELQGQVNTLKGEVNALHKVIKNKDDTIGQLYTELGELKNTCSFLTNETTNLEGQLKISETSLNSLRSKHDQLVDKTSDLEDRSRRNNAIFFNIPEPSAEENKPEDCDSKILNLLKARGFFEHDYTLEIDRAHRLGKQRNGSDSKPRPIIVRFSFYKDKELVIKNGYLFKGSEVNVSEDFSKLTIDMHKQLRTHAKNAQNTLQNDTSQTLSIVHFKTTYRRVVIKYRNGNNATSPTFTKSFSLNYINTNKNWFIPPTRTTYSNIQRFNN